MHTVYNVFSVTAFRLSIAMNNKALHRSTYTDAYVNQENEASGKKAYYEAWFVSSLLYLACHGNSGLK